jgi:hypothetical protein
MPGSVLAGLCVPAAWRQGEYISIDEALTYAKASRVAFERSVASAWLLET